MLCLIAAVLLNPDPYELHRFDGEIHYPPRSRAIAEQVNRLLNNGPSGLKRLDALVMKGEVETRRSYATEALFLNRPAALSSILLLANEDIRELRQIAFAAVYRHPRESWPILVRMAKGGSVGALDLAGSYKHRSVTLSKELINSPHEKIRARTLHFRSDAEVLKLLASNSKVIREAAVETIMVVRPKYKNRVYHHPDGRVRAYAYQLTQRWVERDLKEWVPLTYDEHPEARAWALYQLAPLSMEWFGNQSRYAAIRAVSDAVASDSAAVRKAAIHVTRSWLMHWDYALQTWRKSELDEARRLFATTKFRTEMKKQVGAENYNYPVFVNDIQMAPAVDCLLIIDGKEIPRGRRR